MPVCRDCGKYISDKRWSRHKTKRCSKQKLHKQVSKNIGITVNTNIFEETRIYPGTHKLTSDQAGDMNE